MLIFSKFDLVLLSVLFIDLSQMLPQASTERIALIKHLLAPEKNLSSKKVKSLLYILVVMIRFSYSSVSVSQHLYSLSHFDSSCLASL